MVFPTARFDLDVPLNEIIFIDAINSFKDFKQLIYKIN